MCKSDLKIVDDKSETGCQGCGGCGCGSSKDQTADATPDNLMAAGGGGPLLEAPEHVLSTMEQDGSRRWLQPKLSTGKHWHRRRIVAYVLVAIFVAIPHLRFNGKPLVMLDITSRKFILFGQTFLPTDTLLLALGMVSVFLAIVLATAISGRVWCGWGCPQTVYMEFLFRPIDRWFEGTVGKGGKPKKGLTPPMRVLRWGIYLVLSMFLAHTFLSYFVGTEKLATWIQSSPFQHPTAFLVMAGTTLAMMFDFLFFREQLCLIACPYGRFQSVMLDAKSRIVGYDPGRGEPRRKGKRNVAERLRPLGEKNVVERLRPLELEDLSKRAEPLGYGEDLSKRAEPLGYGEDLSKRAEPLGYEAASIGDSNPPGDCVDCGQCVVVCPTGIDIRNGLQMECINCTQCIDACNDVMDKVGLPQGLIRYTSQDELAGKPSGWLRARTIIYPIALAAAIGGFIIVLSGKYAFDARILRAGGNPFTLETTGLVRNNMRLRLVNRNDLAQSYTVQVLEPKGMSLDVVDDSGLTLDSGGTSLVPISVQLPSSLIAPSGRTDAKIMITDKLGNEREIDFTLLGPKR